MADPAWASLLCPILVGRPACLNAVLSFSTQARAGNGGTLLIAGEAGMGKSRLVREMSAQAIAHGMLVFQGNCFEPDHALPYGPLLDALRSVLRIYPAEVLVSELGTRAHALSQLVPEIDAALPHTIVRSRHDAEQEKRRLFEVLAECFLKLAKQRPLLLVAEDVHWSDDSSLEFFEYLARQVDTYPIALVLTYRSDEVHPALGHFLANLDRNRLARELLLEPLTREDEGAMLRAIFGTQRFMRSGFLDTLYALTEGNPFFVEEVLHALLATGEIDAVSGAWDHMPPKELHIPRTIQDAVRRRTDQLSIEARELLTIAAIVGQRFDFALLEQLTGHSEPDLLQQIKELIAAQLVIEQSEDRFAFRHALTRQTVYLGMLGRERRALHRRVAETLEVLYAAAPEGHVDALAYHHAEGAVWDKALHYAHQAGLQAQALYAPHAAIEQFTRALDAVHHLGIDVPWQLHRARCQAYETLGDFDSARAEGEAALRQARAVANNMQAEWEVLLTLGQLWAGRDYLQTGDYVGQALELARTMDRPHALARSLNQHANWLVNVDEPMRAVQHHREALALFEAESDAEGELETLDLLGIACTVWGDELAAAAYYRRAVDLARALDDRRRLSSALASSTLRAATFQSAALVLPVATLAEAARDAEEAVQIAHDIGQRSGEAFALFLNGLCLGAAGKYSRAFLLAEAGLRAAEEIEHRQWTVGGLYALAELYRDLLDLDRAQELLSAALPVARAIGSGHWTRLCAGTLGSVLIGLGHLDEAEAVLDTTLQGDVASQTLGQGIVSCGRVELALARNAPEAALSLLDELLAATPNATIERMPVRVALLRGQTLTALCQVGEAETSLLAARSIAEVHGARSILWRTWLALGHMYAASRRNQDADRAFVMARDLIDQIAATVPDPILRGAFLQQANILIPTPAVPRRRVATKAGELTHRESEIALLVARGLSNRAIAEALVVSERTVESHVTNILGKLGFTSRAQIATWVTQRRPIEEMPSN